MTKYAFTLQLFSDQYNHKYDSIEYLAKNIIRDMAMQHANNGKLLFSLDEVQTLIMTAYSSTHQQNIEKMIDLKIHYCMKEKWVVKVDEN